MKLASKCRQHVAVLFLSVCFSGTAFAQTAGDPTDPETWRTPEYKAQFWLDYILANYAYAMGVDGSGVKVGVIDSGFARDHPEFAGRYDEGITVQPDKPWYVDSSSVTHGSAVAGVIAANRDGKGMHGVAPGATIVAVNAEEEDGYIDTKAAIAGIYGLVSRNVHIINNSYGLEAAITDYAPDVISSRYKAEIAAYRHAVATDARTPSAASAAAVVSETRGTAAEAGPGRSSSVAGRSRPRCAIPVVTSKGRSEPLSTAPSVSMARRSISQFCANFEKS